MEHFGLGRIQVLRLFVAEHASAEPDDATARVADRKGHPVAEAIVRPTLLVLHEQPGRDEIGIAERRAARSSDPSHPGGAKPMPKSRAITPVRPRAFR